MKRETLTDDLDLLLLSERKRTIPYPDMPSKNLSMKQGSPDFSKAWPGLPKGVKFNPTDEELLWHLLAEIGIGGAKPHPFINKFITSLYEDDMLENAHPQFLPGVKQDGSKAYFFHRKVDMCSSRQAKRQKKDDDSVEILWIKIGRLKPVYVDGIHRGSKEVFAFHTNPINGGNPVKTPWLMHRYQVNTNGVLEDRVVTKIFCKIRPKNDIRDMRTGDFLNDIHDTASPLQLAPEFHEERLLVERDIQDVEELSPKVVDHGMGNDPNVGNVGCLKSPSSKNNLEMARANPDHQSDSVPATNEHPLLESSCEVAEEIGISSDGIKTEISFEDPKEGVVERRMDGFLVNLGDSANNIISSNFDEIRERSCSERTSDNDLMKNARDEMFKTQRTFPSTSLLEINAMSSCSFTSHVSVEDEYCKFLYEDHISSADHSFAHENTINGLAVLALPAFGKKKAKPLNKTEPKSTVEKDSKKLVYISAQSSLPIKMEPKSFDDVEIGVSTEKVLYNSCFLAKAKSEPLERDESGIIAENCIDSTGLIDWHSGRDDNIQDGILMKNENLGDGESFNSPSYGRINIHGGEPQFNTVSSSSSMSIKPEPVDILDHVPLKYRMGTSISDCVDNVRSENIFKGIVPETSRCSSFGSRNSKEVVPSTRRRRKKTATDSVEQAMEEDAPGLLQVLLERGILVEEIKLYGEPEDDDLIKGISSEDSFEELESVIAKLCFERSSLLRFTYGRSVKGSRVYYLSCLISLIEQTRHLRLRQTPMEWGWCRDLLSFIFVFQKHNRIVLERPEYGYATYFFELVDSLPIDWQVKRLVKGMKVTNSSRAVILENKPLIVGEDLSEGEARVLEAYGWTPNTGFGTLLNYCDRVVHDKLNVMHSSEWRAKIGKLLMCGYDGGRVALTSIPEKAVQYLESQSSKDGDLSLPLYM